MIAVQRSLYCRTTKMRRQQKLNPAVRTSDDCAETLLSERLAQNLNRHLVNKKIHG